MSSSITCLGFLVMFNCQVPDPPKPTVVVCPPVVEWSAQDQAAAAAELAKLPAGHPLRAMAIVTVKQRDVVKACQRARGP